MRYRTTTAQYVAKWGIAQMCLCETKYQGGVSHHVGATLTALKKFRDRKGTPKNLCDKDFAELSGELSDAICLKTPVLLGSALELFRRFFGAVRAVLWLWGSFLALEKYRAMWGSAAVVSQYRVIWGH